MGKFNVVSQIPANTLSFICLSTGPSCLTHSKTEIGAGHNSPECVIIILLLENLPPNGNLEGLSVLHAISLFPHERNQYRELVIFKKYRELVTMDLQLSDICCLKVIVCQK